MHTWMTLKIIQIQSNFRAELELNFSPARFWEFEYIFQSGERGSAKYLFTQIKFVYYAGKCYVNSEINTLKTSKINGAYSERLYL